jgi:hypothetical protein
MNRDSNIPNNRSVKNSTSAIKASKPTRMYIVCSKHEKRQAACIVRSMMCCA